MALSPRTLAYLAAGPAALALLGWIDPGQDGAETAAAPNTALNHWTFDTQGATDVEIQTHVWSLVEHMTAAHPSAHFSFYRDFSTLGAARLHFLLETADAEVQQTFLNSYGTDEVCGRLIAFEDERFQIESDIYLRLIASDPAKEVGRREIGLIRWTLEARFSHLGRASECVEALVRHLNATYPDFYFRGYEEWNPEPTSLHIYAYGTGVAVWEHIDGRIRRDPVFRALMEGAADAFVEGSFEDEWFNLIAR